MAATGVAAYARLATNTETVSGMEALQHAATKKGPERRSTFPAYCGEERRTVSSWTNGTAKRCFDFVAASLGLILLSPLLLVAAVAIVCTSEGEALFTQERVGRGEQTFTIYKFRTMCDGAEFCGPSVTCEGDPRVTTVGRWLRSIKLDELPQLYNVVRGDMSLVGPRPKLVSHECGPLPCRPGITGAATLLFTREEELLAKVPADLVERFTVQVLNPVKAKLDARYAEHATFGTDFGLIAATVFRLQWDKRMADLSDLVEAHPEELLKRAVATPIAKPDAFPHKDPIAVNQVA
ncbi:sugar transferase [Terriglobus roseus]|uniref:sugar transferase n=1 Tax=Terriglobus roseus TaxID=392734 RepID=UPI0006941BF1|nr:sugar transferase [Terriglobus roseus]